ncbi:MAG: glycerate kinase [Candidatus Limivivens sp.]|nr:glycerate kinase [Candidatus Limivivens sp.]
MKVVVAIDSFKGSLSSLEAGAAVSRGIRKVFPQAGVEVRPLADGGEGTVEALVLGMNGRLEKITVTGPVGKPVVCTYGILDDRKTAIIEMSGAAGITLLTAEERNPLHTTTYGVGEVIHDAIQKGCRCFLIGIGGSATNDCGIGMLQALGYGFLDKKGDQVAFGAKGLREIVSITDTDVLPELKECSFKIACDVTNPLCGPRGCSAVYGPQKGATPDMIREMDQWLSDFADLAKRNYPEADADAPGTGAAGGMGYAFQTFTNAVLKSGVDIVLEETKLEDYVKAADIVVTGEGRLDGQTVMGKAPIGTAKIAKKYGKPVLAFSGCVTEDAAVCNEHGIDAFFPILRSVVSLEEAMEPENAKKNMEAAAEQVFRLLKICRQNPL